MTYGLNTPDWKVFFSYKLQIILEDYIDSAVMEEIKHLAPFCTLDVIRPVLGAKFPLKHYSHNALKRAVADTCKEVGGVPSGGVEASDLLSYLQEEERQGLFLCTN